MSQPTIFKLPDSVIASAGCKTADEFFAGIAALLASKPGDAIAKLTSDLAASVSSISGIEAKLKTANETISAQASEISTLKAAIGNPASLTEDRIKAIATDAAKVAGSAEASKALGATGAAAPPAAPSSAASTGESASTYNALLVAKQYEKAYAVAPASVKAEFTDIKSYVAFMRFNRPGKVIGKL